MAVKSTRWRSSGTRHAFVSQLSTYLSLGILVRGFLGGLCSRLLGGRFLGLRLRFYLGNRLRFARLALLDHGLAQGVRHPARLLDLLPRGRGESVRGDRQLLLQVPLPEHLHVGPRV